MKKLRMLFALAAAALPVCASVFAGDNPGAASAVFLTLPSDPVTAALGGASAAAQPSPSAIFTNPAVLAGVKTVSGEFSHSLWLEGISYNTMGVAAPCRGGTVAIGLRYLNYGGINTLDNTGNAAGNISPRDIAVSAAWAAELGEGWAAGAAGKYVNSRIAASASAFAADAGLRFSTGRITLGAAVQNLGGKLKYGREGYPLPLSFNAGGAYRIDPGVVLFLDGNIPRSGPGWISTGAQYAFVLGDATLNLRGGYSSRYLDTGGVNGWSAGVGLAVRNMVFNYALTTTGELGVTHQFGLGLSWGAEK